MKKTLLLCFMGAVVSVGAYAQKAASSVSYKTYQFEDGAIIQKMSDNGKWGAFCCQKADERVMVGARLVNLSTTEAFNLIDGLNADTVTSVAAYDVTNDGNIVVGELNAKPAYYNATTKTWTFLRFNGLTGEALAVTPDEKYAVGTIYPSENEYQERGVVWNLATGDTIATNNLPKKDMDHTDEGQNRFIAISADGNRVLGCMSYSYVPSDRDLGGIFYYVYDIKKQSYQVIGFTESDTERWAAKWNNLHFISEAEMSNNGKYVAGVAYIFDSTAAEGSGEFFCPFKYDVDNDLITVYDDANSQSVGAYSVDNSGEVYSGSPEASPYRDAFVRSGNYWVSFVQSINQQYGIDLLNRLGFENSGTPIAVSDDGLTFGMFVGDKDSYCITIPQSIASIAANTNLLSSYSVSPKDGSTFSKLTNVKVTFTRPVQTLVQANKVYLVDQMNGTKLNAFQFSVDAKDPYTINIVFRNATLSTESMMYSLVIPAKSLCIKNDATRYNDEISINYNARENAPVEVTASSPAQNAVIAKIDASTSPITFTFDADIVTTDSVRSVLYQKGVDQPMANLLMAANGDKLYVYPSIQQNLLKDVEYQVVVPKGAVTDITGNAASANETYVLNIKGAYEREISYDSNVLYSEDFNDGLKGVMLYDGDANTPGSEATNLGFVTADHSYAWVPAWDNNETTNRAAMSTSNYNPTGTSDDWLVTPQINIMDKLCTLTFKSQSYRKSKQDYLKVVVWPSDKAYSVLSDAIIEQMKQEGVEVYNKLQSPGKSEAKLAGDWKENTINLEQFAGKNVYIAFVNQNNNQSEVMIDDVKVTHDLPFYAAFDNEETVVNKSEMPISGTLSINDETNTFTALHMTLKDNAGNTVDEINESGLSLKKGDTYKFAFSKALPLTAGVVNRFTVDFKLGDKENSVSKSIRNLMFEPVKRITLEEFTGMGCNNCPLGILGIDNLHKLYGDLFIPMALHCYTGDPLAAGVTNYAAFLNLTAAPSGIIQRGNITYPITQDNADASYSFYPSATTVYNVTWASEVERELATPAQAEITATCTLSANGKNLNVPCSVKYALNASDLNLKLFAVVLENDLVGYQSNSFSSISDPTIGEWGQGGKYGVASVNPYTFDHVVRGYYGETFTGTPDLFPTTIEAGKEYTTTLTVPMPSVVSDVNNTEVVVMLFDGNTDKLINAYKVKPTNTVDGIDEITNDRTTAAVVVTAQNGNVVVSSPIAATVQVIGLDGRTTAIAKGEGVITLSPATNGVAIVRVSTANGVVTKKVILK